jgi:signal transduction histidine kinase
LASIHKEIVIHAAPAAVWDAVRDTGAVHQRLARGFVTDVRLEDDERVVMFANGLVARELIVDIDDDRRRLAYAAIQGRAKHHHASMQVFAMPGGLSQLVWITDVLPHELRGPLTAMVEQGALAIKQTLETM